MINRSLIFLWCSLASALLPFCGMAQKVEISVNRNNIVIGEQIEYGLKVQVPSPGYKVHFVIPDSVPHFDIISKGEISTLPGSPPSLEQVITFTSFDSGSWVFPSIPVLVTDGRRKLNLASSTVLVQVGYSPEDTTGIYDIRAVRKVSVVDNFWYYVAAGLLLLIFLAWLIYRYLKKRRNRPKPVFSSLLSPLEEAMAELNKLESESPPLKELHTRAGEAFKKFISRKWQSDVSNKTSGELLMQLSTRYDDAKITGMVADPLRLGDAVKYAKFRPSDQENLLAIRSWKEVVNTIDQLRIKI